MKDTYSSFLNVLRNTIRTAGDRLPEDLKDPSEQKFFNFSSKEFLKHFYCSRRSESIMLNQLLVAPDIICLVGDRGSGKSSIAIKLKNHFDDNYPNNYKFFYLDIRGYVHREVFKFNNREEAISSIKKIITGLYLEQLFPITENEIINRLKLYSFILSNNSEADKPLSLFLDFLPLKDPIILKFRNYKAIKNKQENYSILDWLVETYNDDTDLQKALSTLQDKISIVHLVFAVKEIYKFNRQILWVDNIDRLNDIAQNEVLEYLRNAFSNYQNFLAIAYSIREENVLRDYEIAEEEAPPYISKIMLDDNMYKYDACEISMASFEAITSIINKRLFYSFAFQRGICLSLRDELASNLKKLNAKTTISEILKNELLKRNTEINDHLKLFSPELSDYEFKYIQMISEEILNTCYKENAIYISNNSIRGFLFGYYSFLRFVLSIPYKKEDFPNENLRPNYPAVLHYCSEEKYGKWMWSTLFFIFIRDSNIEQKLGLYDIIEHLQQGGCLLQNIIISSIWNLTLEGYDERLKIYKNTNVKKVISRIKLLGYSSEEILDAMYKLYRIYHIRGNLIEFRDRTIIKDIADIKEDMLVYVTHRGKCFASNTGKSLGFLYECIRHYEVTDTIELQKIPIHSFEVYFEKVLPYLIKIGNSHLDAFTDICKNGKLNVNNKHDQYRKLFGIPQIYPFNKNVARKQRISNIERKLILELILDRIAILKMTDSMRSVIANLKQRYLDEIINISNNDFIKNPNFSPIHLD
jgi:GTPase SAR1 family protein